MPRQLAPLNGLRAFEVAARHLSFVKAAEELGVTAAAVSQQVKGLEEYFDVKLFERLTRALRLTDAGHAILPSLQQGLEKIGQVDKILRSRQDSRVLTVSVAPSFGAKWLVPRMSHFRAEHPEYDLRIDATDEQADFNRDNVDIAVRYGRGDYPGLTSICLLTEKTFPVCSPALQAGQHPLSEPGDLRHHTLLHAQWRMEDETAPNWRMWLRAAGIANVDADRGPRFNVEEMIVQAAIEGQGVALVSSALVADDINRGRLVRPFPEAINQQTRFQYNVVFPEHEENNPKIAAFKNWILAQAQSSEDASA